METLAEAAAVFVKPAYEPELEKMRLAFEQQKWQHEMEQQEKFEQAKLAAEEKERTAERTCASQTRC